MSKSLPLMLRHAMYNLRGGFLIRPLTIALALGCVGAFLSRLEEELPVTSAWVPTVLFPSHADPQVAQVILARIIREEAPWNRSWNRSGPPADVSGWPWWFARRREAPADPGVLTQPVDSTMDGCDNQYRAESSRGW